MRGSAQVTGNVEKSDHFIDALKTAVATSIDTITFQDISVVGSELYCPPSASAPAAVPTAGPDALAGRRLLSVSWYQEGPSRGLRAPARPVEVSTITRLRAGDGIAFPDGLQGLGFPLQEAPGWPEDPPQGPGTLERHPAGRGGLDGVRRISVFRQPELRNPANSTALYGDVAGVLGDLLQTGRPSASGLGEVLQAGPSPGPQGPRSVPRRALAQAPMLPPSLNRKGNDSAPALPPGCVGLNVTMLMTPSSPDHQLKQKVGGPCSPRQLPKLFSKVA